VIGPGKITADNFVHAICEQYRQVIPEHCVTHRRLDTEAGGAAGEYQMPDA
jgi:hypothetical protein